MEITFSFGFYISKNKKVLNRKFNILIPCGWFIVVLFCFEVRGRRDMDLWTLKFFWRYYIQNINHADWGVSPREKVSFISSFSFFISYLSILFVSLLSACISF